MGIDFPLFLAALTAFAIAVAWVAATLMTRLQGRRPVAPETATVRTPAPFSGRAWIIDGDTLKVGRHRVRLFGMDAPELSQRGGGKAKSRLIGIAGGAEVRVEPLTMDCYGRVVAKVWRGDTDLSERMVRDGYAVATARWNRDYLPAEREARFDRRGLWAFDPIDGIEDPSKHRALTRANASPRPAAQTKVVPIPRNPWLR